MSGYNSENEGLGGCLGIILVVVVIVWWEHVLTLGITGLIAYFLFKFAKKQYIKIRENKKSNKLLKVLEIEKQNILNNIGNVKIEEPLQMQDGFNFESNDQLMLDLREKYDYFGQLPNKIEKLTLEKFGKYTSSPRSVTTVWDIKDVLSNTKHYSLELLIDFLNTQNYYSSDKWIVTEKEIFEQIGINLSDASRYKELNRQIDAELKKIIDECAIDISSTTNGVKGEERVKEALSIYKDILTTMESVRFEVDGTSVESDFIVVCSKGIFTIEVKNYGEKGGYTIKISKDGQWQKVYSDGNIEPMKDVATQANLHVALKQRLINNVLKNKYDQNHEYVYVDSIISIANDNVFVQNESDMPILRASQIYNYIKSKPDILSPEQISIIKDIISEHSLPPKKYPVRDYVSSLKKLLDNVLPIYDYCNKVMTTHKTICGISDKNKVIKEEFDPDWKFWIGVLFKNETRSNRNFERLEETLSKKDI